MDYGAKYNIEYNNFKSMDEVNNFFADNPKSIRILDDKENTSHNLEIALLTIRDIRISLLRESDIYLLADYPITEEKKEEWKIYRQSLRDITNGITEGGFLIFDHNMHIYLFKEGFSWQTPPSP
tara:strand:- start:335 stop:706 length:372 start_codon:yes stop_codon:yes gene_type:complete